MAARRARQRRAPPARVRLHGAPVREHLQGRLHGGRRSLEEEERLGALLQTAEIGLLARFSPQAALCALSLAEPTSARREARGGVLGQARLGGRETLDICPLRAPSAGPPLRAGGEDAGVLVGEGGDRRGGALRGARPPARRLGRLPRAHLGAAARLCGRARRELLQRRQPELRRVPARRLRDALARVRARTHTDTHTLRATAAAAEAAAAIRSAAAAAHLLQGRRGAPPRLRHLRRVLTATATSPPPPQATTS